MGRPAHPRRSRRIARRRKRSADSMGATQRHPRRENREVPGQSRRLQRGCFLRREAAAAAHHPADPVRGAHRGERRRTRALVLRLRGLLADRDPGGRRGDRHRPRVGPPARRDRRPAAERAGARRDRGRADLGHVRIGELHTAVDAGRGVSVDPRDRSGVGRRARRGVRDRGRAGRRRRIPRRRDARHHRRAARGAREQPQPRGDRPLPRRGA